MRTFKIFLYFLFNRVFVSCFDWGSAVEIDGNEDIDMYSDEVREMVCGEGLVWCNGGCVNILLDRNNCGECGKRCDALAICNNGRCECQFGLVECNGNCVDTKTDKQNCGECGHACNENQVCNGEGICVTQCSSGETLCEGNHPYCAKIDSDTMNCGRCGNVCGPYEHAFAVCLNGECRMLCDSGYEDTNRDIKDGCECKITGIEICDGVDNDCNGRADDVFECALGEVNVCIAYDTCRGLQRCETPNCIFGSCFSEEWDCSPPGNMQQADCGESCGYTTRTCLDDFRWSDLDSECHLKLGSECFPWETRNCGICGTQNCTPECRWGICNDPCV